MGNDGGSIPKRSELVKEAAKALTASQLKEAQTEAQTYAWSTDPLTRKPLARPVVSDAAGILYNKDSIIEFLLKEEGDVEKAEMRKVCAVKGGEGGFSELGTFGDRVKGLKDVVEVKFEVAESSGNGQGEKWVCPITGTALGSGAKAVYIVPCGHAFAKSVVDEVKESACLTCSEPYASNDVIPILATLPTDLARLNLRLRTLKEKGLTHALKKAPGSKKRKKDKDASASNGNGTLPAESNGTSKPHSSDDDKKSSKRKDALTGTSTPNSGTSTPTTNSNDNGIKNATTASLTRKVLAEQEERNKRRKLAQNDNVNSLFSKSDGKDGPRLGNSADYMTRGFSIGKK